MSRFCSFSEEFRIRFVIEIVIEIKSSRKQKLFHVEHYIKKSMSISILGLEKIRKKLTISPFVDCYKLYICQIFIKEYNTYIHKSFISYKSSSYECTSDICKRKVYMKSSYKSLEKKAMKNFTKNKNSLPTKPSIPIICTISGLSLFSETVYSPSITKIAEDLLTSVNKVEQTLTIYLFGFALGVFFWGPLSDKIGRKPCVMRGLAIFIIGCLMCYFSNNISFLMVSRFIQSFGGAIGSVLAQAIIRDSFEGKELTRVYLSNSIAISIFPAIGPTIGSFIAHFFSWKLSFLILALTSFAILILIYLRLPETIQVKEESDSNKKDIIFSYRNDIRNIFLFSKEFFTDRKIIKLGLLIGLSLGISFSYFAEAPFFFIKKLHVSQEYYGMTFMFISVFAMLAGIIGKILNKKHSHDRIVKISIAIILCGVALFFCSTWMYILNYFTSAQSMVNLSVSSRSIILFGQILFANVILSMALSDYKRKIGTASSLFGLYYYGVTSCVTFVMGCIHNGSMYVMPTYFLIILVGIVLVYKKFQYVE